MTIAGTLAACVLAVSAHYRVPTGQVAAALERPSRFPSIGAAHIPRTWLPLLVKSGFKQKTIAQDPCASVVAAGWILAYEQSFERQWAAAKTAALKLPSRAIHWQPVIRAYSKLAGVDANLINALILQESGFKAGIVSSAGAIGLMQITPVTAKALKINPWDARQNLWGGIWYVRNLMARYHGNLALTLAAYNAGPQAVDRYSGIPPFRETQHYVPAVLRNYRELLASDINWGVKTALPLSSE
jgi:soluble lytic murein transglycosylase-like protein